MKILLVGEYSRLHNSLKEGLTLLNHEVTLISTGDYFKDFPADIKLKRRFDQSVGKKVKVLIFKLLKFDITSYLLKRDFFKHQDYLTGFDVVQLINEKPLGISCKHEKEVIKFLKLKNKKLFLLSCGNDYINIKFLTATKSLKYSIITPYQEGKIEKKKFSSVLNRLSKEHYHLHQFLLKQVDGIIASDIDYHLPLTEHPLYKGLIPNPINLDLLEYKQNPINHKIIIFHGINRGNYYKKGNDFFEKALKIVKEKYAQKVDIITTENIPYQEYITYYNKAHILLDMVYAYDQGYNALEAMAKGKVVFTGAETEFLENYDLQENEVCINALPDINYLVEKLSWLIENPEKIKDISLNARAFIKQHHECKKIAKKYIEIYTKS